MVILGICLWATTQSAIKPTEARKQIQAQYDRWSKAYMANDVDTLLAILSPDYALTNVQKETITLKTYKAYLELRRKGPKDTTQYKTKINRLTLTLSGADVDSSEVMTTAKGGKISIHTHEYLDRWVLKDKTWLLMSTRTLKESTVVKG